MKVVDPATFWDQSEFAMREYVDEPLTDELLLRVEETLGRRLPKAYVELCRGQNGGEPVNACIRTMEATSWASDHVKITNIKGIGFANRWALCGLFGHPHYAEGYAYFVEDGAPPLDGIFFADCPSAGHDALVLNYGDLNSDGEPSVAHVELEGEVAILRIADSFEAFLQALESWEAFESETD